MRPLSSCRPPRMRVSTRIGFCAAPPKMPECRSRLAALIRTSSYISPRSEVVMAGVSRSHMPVSQTKAKSAFRSSLFFSRNGTKFFEPISSSPSMTMVTSTGSEPVTDFQARQASTKVINCPLSSSAPRATMIFRPSAWSVTAGSKGGRCQRLSGSTGCTS